MSATAVKERPILFSGEMVRAILAGTKTQTRRIIKPQPPEGWHPLGVERYFPATEDRDGMLTDGPEIFGAYGWDWGVKCPYGGPGDVLWVREEHYRVGHWEPVPGVKTKSGRMKWRFVADSCDVRFAPPAEYRKGRHHKDSATPAWHKRPARFMPRRIARITLELTDVRVERVQDISEADALAEGCVRPVIGCARDEFYGLWNRVNGDGAWERNDWCWVLYVRRLP